MRKSCSTTSSSSDPTPTPQGCAGRLTRPKPRGESRVARSRFISRGDQSGTHEREQALWKAAGAVPTGDRLVVAGAGMGATLRIAGETGSYTLTDRATYAQQKDRRSLAIVYENDAALLNTYAVVFDPADSARCRREDVHGLADRRTRTWGHRQLPRRCRGPRLRSVASRASQDESRGSPALTLLFDRADRQLLGVLVSRSRHARHLHGFRRRVFGFRSKVEERPIEQVQDGFAVTLDDLAVGGDPRVGGFVAEAPDVRRICSNVILFSASDGCRLNPSRATARPSALRPASSTRRSWRASRRRNPGR